MALLYILNQLGAKMGLDPAEVSQRATLLRFINEAANELYDLNDADGILREQLFQVNGDLSIALPSNVGPLRAMREYSTHVAWHLYNMRPRYNQFNWKDRWRGWRLKGTSPLIAGITNEAPLTLTVPVVENPPVIVSLTGVTATASGISEQVTMDNVTKMGTLVFTEVKNIKKDRVNGCDITITDADSKVMSVVPNNMLQVRYRIVDVSLYPFASTASMNDHYMEVLYKEALPWLENDDDEFPAEGYDNIIVNKALQLWSEEQGKVEAALGYDAKASRSLAMKQEDANRGAEQEVALVENPHDTLLPRNRPIGPGRYTGQVYY